MLDEQKLKEMGKKIRTLRQQKGLLQADLAEALEFDTVSAISKLENGNGGRQPALGKLTKIATVLGCTLDELIPMQSEEEDDDGEPVE